VTSYPLPVQVTPFQRDTLDELERKALGRADRWVPAGAVHRHGALAHLVELGLVEERRQPIGDGEVGETFFRRDASALFVVVLPRSTLATAVRRRNARPK
jgi:hypothetical protein